MAVIGNAPSVALEHMLLALDFSRCSESAMDYAQMFAQRFSSKLTIANVVDLSLLARSGEVISGKQLDYVRRESTENIERAVTQVSEAGVKAEGKSVEAYNPALRMVQLAKQLGAELIVVGSHGRRGMNKFLLGSFAEGVIHQASCPVLTIGPKVKPAGDSLILNTVLFASDLQHQTVEKARVALVFAEDSMAHVVLCHVVARPPSKLEDALDQQFSAEAALKRLIPNAAYDWCSPEIDVDYGDPAKRILLLAEQNHADLIVMGARRGTTWFTHFTKGVAAGVIEQATCPVMTICND